LPISITLIIQPKNSVITRFPSLLLQGLGADNVGCFGPQIASIRTDEILQILDEPAFYRVRAVVAAPFRACCSS
jgi:hypothetical protein